MTQPPNLVPDVLRIVADAAESANMAVLEHGTSWIVELINNLRAEAARLSAQTAAGADGSLLRPASARSPDVCYCKPGRCAAPKPEWCKDHAKRDAVAATPPSPTTAGADCTDDHCETVGPAVTGELRADESEQNAFEAWAKARGYDMETHPLHWLFLNPMTSHARKGWKAAVEWSATRTPAAADGWKLPGVDY